LIQYVSLTSFIFSLYRAKTDLEFNQIPKANKCPLFAMIIELSLHLLHTQISFQKRFSL